MGHFRGSPRCGISAIRRPWSAAPEGKELTAMLLAGEIDAAILPAVPTDPA